MMTKTKAERQAASARGEADRKVRLAAEAAAKRTAEAFRQTERYAMPDRLVEAIGELVQAKIDLAESRRTNPEYYNGDDVTKAEGRLTTLLWDVLGLDHD